MEPLPPGWYYNGGQYVDMTGEKSSQHPEFSKYLEEYVCRENESIRLHNEEIDRMELHDLFE